MDVFAEAKKRPVMSGITLVGAAGVVVLAMNVMPGLELIVRIKKAPDVADAAYEKALESREWIDEYIKQQKQQQALEQQRYELEQEFNKKLLELQQQQTPNQSYQPQRSPPQMQTIPNLPYPQPQWEWRQDEQGNWFCTDGQESWWPNDNGDCE